MNVDTIEAGPELDALVAEKVMGLKVVNPCPGRMTDAANGSCYSCDTCAYYEDHGAVDHCYLPKPYSTDIAAAWEVVEKVRLIVGRDIHNSWVARDDWDFDAATVAGRAETAPLAICRAALKAVGA